MKCLAASMKANALYAQSTSKTKDKFGDLLTEKLLGYFKPDMLGHLVNKYVELDTLTETLLQRAKTNMVTRQKELRGRLTWLTSNVRILNTRNYNNEVESMEVSPKCS